jgi:hypothetical protein
MLSIGRTSSISEVAQCIANHTICQASYEELKKLNVLVIITLTATKKRNRCIVKIGLIGIGLLN